jgi:hypothetical protein
MSEISVLVIGRLGELVKKVFELEDLIEADPKNDVAILQLATYSEIMEQWPVDDVSIMPILLTDFRMAFNRYRDAGLVLEEDVAFRNESRLGLDVCSYLSSKNNLKEKIAKLNNMGRYVGNVPIMKLTGE